MGDSHCKTISRKKFPLRKWNMNYSNGLLLRSTQFGERENTILSFYPPLRGRSKSWSSTFAPFFIHPRSINDKSLGSPVVQIGLLFPVKIESKPLPSFIPSFGLACKSGLRAKPKPLRLAIINETCHLGRKDAKKALCRLWGRQKSHFLRRVWTMSIISYAWKNFHFTNESLFKTLSFSPIGISDKDPRPTDRPTGEKAKTVTTTINSSSQETTKENYRKEEPSYDDKNVIYYFEEGN